MGTVERPKLKRIAVNIAVSITIPPLLVLSFWGLLKDQVLKRPVVSAQVLGCYGRGEPDYEIHLGDLSLVTGRSGEVQFNRVDFDPPEKEFYIHKVGSSEVLRTRLSVRKGTDLSVVVVLCPRTLGSEEAHGSLTE